MDIKKTVEKDDDEKLEVPSAAFITFEKPAGVVCALQSNKSPLLKSEKAEILPG